MYHTNNNEWNEFNNTLLWKDTTITNLHPFVIDKDEKVQKQQNYFIILEKTDETSTQIIVSPHPHSKQILILCD